jgi:hypothetical protein
LLLKQGAAYPRFMRIVQIVAVLLFSIVLVDESGGCDQELRVIAFGRWTFVQWFAGRETEKPASLKIRPLLIDGSVKEYMLGAPDEVTERLFRAARCSDE